MLNLCFFFEKPCSTEEYNVANKKNILDNLGALSPVRWEHIGEIHVLSPSKDGHIYAARQADLPHYQDVFSNFVSVLQTYNAKLAVYLYLPGSDYENHFMSVHNSLQSVKPFADTIDWDEIHRVACRPKKNDKKNLLKENAKTHSRIPVIVAR